MQYYNCYTILMCKFNFVNSKWKKALMWENPVNSNICVRENICISLSPSMRLNHHHIPWFGLIPLVSIFTGVQYMYPWWCHCHNEHSQVDVLSPKIALHSKRQHTVIGWLSVSIKTYPHNKWGASQSLNAFQEFSKIERLWVQMNWKKCFDLSETQLREFRECGVPK